MPLQPAIYDVVQFATGIRRSFQQLSPHVAEWGDKRILDVGGGTGVYAQILPSTSRYTCLDADRAKLTRAARVTLKLIQGDATQLPVASKSIDCALCVGVAHHLTDGAFDSMIRELARVVRDRVLVLEPIRSHGSALRRLFWSMDSGSWPRSEGQLVEHLSAWFSCEHHETYDVLHRYLLYVGAPKDS